LPGGSERRRILAVGPRGCHAGERNGVREVRIPTGLTSCSLTCRAFPS